VLIATAIAGIASYLVTWFVPREIGLAAYAVFAIFWSTIYLVVGALSGVQQEITRGTSPVEVGTALHPRRARNFGIAASIIVFVLVAGSSPFWGGRVFGDASWQLSLPLGVGAASYVLVAVLSGTLYGRSAWTSVATLIVLDAALRLVGLLVVLAFTRNVVALAWAVALPFPLALIFTWPFLRRLVVNRTDFDSGYRKLTWNVIRTIAAALATGIMVSGFPLLLGLTTHGVPKATVGLYVLTLTLARAPLIVIAMSLQSLLLVRFRGRLLDLFGDVARILAILAAGGVVLALAGALVGPAIWGVLFPHELAPTPGFIVVMVISSALVGMMCITGPAVLSRAGHGVYTGGWIAGALVTIVVLLLPLEFTSRFFLALLCGPVAGLLIHGAWLAAQRWRITEVTRTS
jgi:hypothetical protein